MKIDNNMPDEFFDWLDQCPVNWYMNEYDNVVMNYSFQVPEKESEEE
jgi:hypothetical protein